MIHQVRNPHFYVLLLADVAAFVVSLMFAYAVRFSFEIPKSEWNSMWEIMPAVMATKVGVYFFLGVYRGMWRYTSMADLVRLLKATVLACLLITVALTMLCRFEGYPRSVFLADGVFTLFLCGALRAGIRMAYSPNWLSKLASDSKGTVPLRRARLLILGAGDAADKIIREIQGNERTPFVVVACLDDDRSKNGRALHGIPVRAPIVDLPRFATEFDVDEVIIAMPSLRGDDMRRIVRICENSGMPFRTLPSIASLVDGRVTVNDLRQVRYEDLLGRPPVRLDMRRIGEYLAGKTVVVTGAGGSIGSELCRQIAVFGPDSLVLLDSSEFNLYRVEMELRGSKKPLGLYPVMGRVQDRSLMERVFRRYRPQVVFHAAACKHVPMVETNPWEGVSCNVTGSAVTMDVAAESGVERFVLVSSDKAVRPTNVMGATKRMAELLLQSRTVGGTLFMAVRFGNVVGSSGSVIPMFQEQIRSGGPITVTHPEITRYFMTIPEAAQLILQAGGMGEGGEVFVLEMGTPVRIADLARDLILLSGKEPETDIGIVFTGLRPGEKLYEELITRGEGIVPTPHEKIMVLRRGEPSSTAEKARIAAGLAELTVASTAHDSVAIKQALHWLVPDYSPANHPSVLDSAETCNPPSGPASTSETEIPPD